jgi:hypothetical protein
MRWGSACEQDNAVICIRYKDFSAGTHNITGLHGVARRGARGVTVYLVPGLNVRERRAVLRRLRQEASRGYGPPLPLLALGLALCADRLRTAGGTGAALIRLHPAVTLLPGAFVAAVMTLFVLASAGRSVDFTPGSAPGGSGLALSPGGRASGIVGPQPSPVWDRQAFTVDNFGPARGAYGGQPLGLGQPAVGKCAHDRCAKGKAKGRSTAKGGNGSSGSGKGSNGNGKGDGGPADGTQRTAVSAVKCTKASPARCLASVQSADVLRIPGDRPPARPARLGTVKGGVGVGHHGG